MGPKAFKISLALIGGLIALSATPGLGAMVGLFFAFSIAFFLAPLAFGLQWAAHGAALTIKLEHLLYVMLVLYAACVMTGAYQAWRTWSAGHLDRARLIGAKAALFAALPLAAYLSSDALIKAWR